VLKPGDVIGGCTVQEFLGEGSMGQVYRCTRQEQSVAVKIMHSSRPLVPGHLDPEWRRFSIRLKALSRLRHPALIQIDTWGRDEQRACLWLAMELLNGTDLQAHTHRRPMAAQHVRAIFAQLAHGLSVAHNDGLLHGDIKPANLFLRTDGTAVMMDFCLPVHRTQDGDFADHVPLGTPCYLPPESLVGRQLGSMAGDVYSLGQAMYETVTAKSAFDTSGNGHERLISLVRAKQHARPLDPGPGSGRAVRRAVRWCTQPDPSRRPTASQLRELLEGENTLTNLPMRWLNAIDAWRRAGQ
jgi:serine/threonine protein kinase